MQQPIMLLAVLIGSAHAMRAKVTLRANNSVVPKVCLTDDMPGNSVDSKCGHMAAFQTAFAQMSQPGWKDYPEEPAPFEYAERLSQTCKEPKNRPHSFNGAGPPVIYCCHTAEEKVAEFERKEAHCGEKELPVPCWKTLEKAIPVYLMYYRSRVADLCKTTTTTTTTTIATTTTTTQAESITKETGNVTTSDSLDEEFGAFCLRKCEAMVVMKKGKSCEDLCGVLDERHQAEMDALKKNMSSGGSGANGAGGAAGANGTGGAAGANGTGGAAGANGAVGAAGAEVDCSKCPAAEDAPEEAKPAAEDAKSKGNETAEGNKTA